MKELRLYECGLGAESVQLISERLMETKHNVSPISYLPKELIDP